MSHGHLEDVSLLELGVSGRVLVERRQNERLEFHETAVDASSSLLLHDRLGDATMLGSLGGRLGARHLARGRLHRGTTNVCSHVAFGL